MRAMKYDAEMRPLVSRPRSTPRCARSSHLSHRHGSSAPISRTRHATEEDGIMAMFSRALPCMWTSRRYAPWRAEPLGTSPSVDAAAQRRAREIRFESGPDRAGQRSTTMERISMPLLKNISTKYTSVGAKHVICCKLRMVCPFRLFVIRSNRIRFTD